VHYKEIEKVSLVIDAENGLGLKDCKM
jgi:hypothetical protein